jgi:phospholipid/cholesterol/gamma-HCH transport system substrate-binding protein
MSTPKAELAVGLFALLVMAVLSFMTFRVGEFPFMKKKGYDVYAEFLNTAGLDVKTKVRIAGVEAGTVDKIELVGGKARVTLRMKKDVTLYSDAKAHIKSTGLLGEKYLELTPGSKEPTIKDGDHITNIVEAADIAELIRNLSNISHRLMEFMSGFELEDVQEAFAEPLENIRVITRELKDIVTGNKEKFSRIVDRVDSITARIDDFLEKNEGALTKTASNAAELTEDLKLAARDLRDVLKSAAPELTTAAEKASSTMDSINLIANKINQGEGTIGKLVHDDRLYESLDKAARGIGNTLSSLDRFRTFVSFRGDYLTKAGRTKGAFYLTLQPRKDKFYVLGLIRDPVGLVSTTETTTNGVSEVEEKVEDRFEFTAHFAKRFNNTALRIGLTENTFGLGADKFMLDDRLRLSIDAWDFRRAEEGSVDAHVRIGTDYFLFKNLFISGGMDNVLNSQRSGVFVGGGVSFEDEDLKYLLGATPKMPVN